MTDEDPERGAPGLIVWIMLVACLPLALLGAFSPPNEYEAILGIDALDCDGPAQVYLLAIPALAIYAMGFIISARQWRRKANLLACLLCLAVCAALAAIMKRAEDVRASQADACAVR